MELQMRLISGLRSCCHEIIKTDPLFTELQDSKYKPIPYTSSLQKIQQERLFIDAPYDPNFPNAVRRFRSHVLYKVVAAMLHFFWKMETVGFVRGLDKRVNIRILAIPVSFVSPNLIFILSILINLTEIFQLHNELRMNQTSEWICKISSLQEFTRAEQLDLSVTVSELDRIESEGGLERDTIQLDLQGLIDCY
jgi:hypothetical protein